MMRQYELVELVQAYNPAADEALLNRAYVYGMQKHGSQTRASGDPYFAHPLEVAAILTELKMDDATIAVALLHDTIEDTDATRAEIDGLFGAEIGRLVEGLTKIERLDLVSREAAQAENLRKLLLAISDDIRVLLVKLADRLHNMRTLEFMREDKRTRISQETMDIYAPLAGRMGMQEMRGELEDLSFRYLHPEPYKLLSSKLDELGQKNKNTIARVEGELREIFSEKNIEVKVSGRLKRAYSMFRKMERKSLGLEQLSDIFGFRIVVESEDDCYRALGVVHRNWSVVPGRFKDYISTPKQNDYRSLHTTIVGPGRQRVELQIRTDQMHEIAEYGIAAHALYKDEMSGDMSKLEKESNAYGWLRRTVEHLVEGDNPEDFIEHTKLEFFQDQVFCFTPRGRLILLPLGATPIDFAYAVHTDIGNTCVGCKVNGKIEPVVSSLSNGDEVEILCSESHVPPEAWLGAVLTGKARAAIRRVTRLAAQKKYAAIGEQILLAAVARYGKAELSKSNLARLMSHYRLSEPIELYVAMGSGEISSQGAIEILHPSDVEKTLEEVAPEGVVTPIDVDEGWFELHGSPHLLFRMPGVRYNPDEAQEVMRLIDPDLPVKFSVEGAVPGDRIIGILMPQEGLTIYPVHAQALEKFHNDPNAIWLDVQWNETSIGQSRFAVAVNMTVLNKPNVLAIIASNIGDQQINIHNLQMFAASPDFHELLFQIEVRDVKHLNQLLFDLRQLSEITKVSRATTVQAALLAQSFVGYPTVK